MSALQQKSAGRIASLLSSPRETTFSRNISTVAIVLTIVSIAGLVLSRFVRRDSLLHRLRFSNSARSRRLSRAIIGADQKMILARLGPPRAMARASSDCAQTWYYPVDPRRRLALAVKFVGGIVRDANVLRGP